MVPGVKRRILILDPNAAFAMKLRFSLLREYGSDVEVEATPDPAAVLRHLGEGTFDLIVAEVVLNRVETFQFIEQVATLAPRTRLLVTSEFFALADIEREFSSRTLLTCVRKPIQPDALAALVIRWLEGKVSAAENEDLIDLIQLIRIERINCVLSIEGTRDFAHAGGRVIYSNGEVSSQTCWVGQRSVPLEQLLRYPSHRFTVSRPAVTQNPGPAPLLDTSDLIRRAHKRTTRLVPQRIELRSGPTPVPQPAPSPSAG